MDSDYLLKICLFADKNVGKETLAKSEFLISPFEKYLTTTGVHHATKELEIPGKIIRLQFWIISDKEQFENIWDRFIIGSLGVILMYDITNVKTLNRLVEWCAMVKNYKDDIPILLVGNKSDLEDQREVSDEILERFKQDNAIVSSMEISIKTGENVEKMIFTLACMAFRLDTKEVLAEMLEEKCEYFIWKIDRAIKNTRKKFESKRKLKKQEMLWRKYHFGGTETFEEYVDHQKGQIITFVDVKKKIMEAQKLPELLKIWQKVENLLKP